MRQHDGQERADVLRVSELCDLTSKDVLWQRRQLRVRGKGGPYGKKSKVRVVLDPSIADRQVRAAIYRQVPPEALRATVERSEGLSRPSDDHHFDFLADRYSYLRQFAPQFLDALTFHPNRAGAPILEAIALLRDLTPAGNADCRRGPRVRTP